MSDHHISGWELLRRFVIVVGLLFVAAWLADAQTLERIFSSDPSNAAASAAKLPASASGK